MKIAVVLLVSALAVSASSASAQPPPPDSESERPVREDASPGAEPDVAPTADDEAEQDAASEVDEEAEQDAAGEVDEEAAKDAEAKAKQRRAETRAKRRANKKARELADAPEAPPPTQTVTSRSRIWLRLDPAARPDPDGTVAAGAIGSFAVVARGPWEAEASGWLAHAPGAPAYADDAVSGDVRTLFARRQFGEVRVAAGRQWTMVGGQRIQLVDGLTADWAFDPRVTGAVRLGRSGPKPGDAFGDANEFGVEARVEATETLDIDVGVLHSRMDEAPARTRWTTVADYVTSPFWTARGAATADVAAVELVEARVELGARPREDLWVRAYARRADLSQLFAADELLAVFATTDHDEIGGHAAWMKRPDLRLRLDVALVRSEDRDAAGRYRAAADVYPKAGAWATGEGTLRLDRGGRSATLRAATRWPLGDTWFGSFELIGDRIEDVDEEDALHDVASRGGLGFEPWLGWAVYGALEAGAGGRFDQRIGGLVIVEQTHGAPVRWGVTP